MQLWAELSFQVASLKEEGEGGAALLLRSCYGHHGHFPAFSQKHASQRRASSGL